MMIINIRKYVLLTIDILWILLVLNQYRIWTMFVLYSNEYGKSDIFPALVSFTIFSVLLIIIPILTILRIWRGTNNINITEILIHIILLCFLIVSFFGIPSRYRVLIWNNTGNKLIIKVEEGEKFPDPNYPTSTIEDNGKYIINITEQDGGHFTIMASQSGTIWNVYDKYEVYQRSIFDISEGQRIDYFLEPYGKVRKEYWH